MTKGVSEAITDVLFEYNDVSTFNDYLFEKYNDSMDKEIEKIISNSKLNNVYYISMKDVQCDSSMQKCFGLDQEFNLLYRDTIHWTIPGAKFFMKRMLEHPKFKRLILGEENE